jgi:hypothetical protein
MRTLLILFSELSSLLDPLHISSRDPDLYDPEEETLSPDEMAMILENAYIFEIQIEGRSQQRNYLIWSRTGAPAPHRAIIFNARIFTTLMMSSTPFGR